MNIIAPIALSLLLAGPALAQQVDTSTGTATGKIYVGTNLICDTPQEVQRFVSIFSGNVKAAMDTVNTEAKTPDACVLATAAFVPGEDRAIAVKKDKTFRVVQIFVVGVYTKSGMQIVQPAEFFTLMPGSKPPATVGERL